jgi:ABC-type taurine transport system ATPase subunit
MMPVRIPRASQIFASALWRLRLRNVAYIERRLTAFAILAIVTFPLYYVRLGVRLSPALRKPDPAPDRIGAVRAHAVQPPLAGMDEVLAALLLVRSRCSTRCPSSSPTCC